MFLFRKDVEIVNMNVCLEDEGGFVVFLQRKIKEFQVFSIYLLKIYLGIFKNKVLNWEFRKNRENNKNINIQLIFGLVVDINYDF